MVRNHGLIVEKGVQGWRSRRLIGDMDYPGSGPLIGKTPTSCSMYYEVETITVVDPARLLRPDVLRWILDALYVPFPNLYILG